MTTIAPHHKHHAGGRSPDRRPLGVTPQSDGRYAIAVWAPAAERVEVCLRGPQELRIKLDAGPQGYHGGIVEQLQPGVRYALSLDGGPMRPDPASRFQPEGPHGPSQVASPDFPWTDAAWRNLPLDRYVIYELHVGTFTTEGTFDGIVPHLRGLHDLGITAVELMPVAQFPGDRNWGYDGVGLYAAHNSYGGPDGLRRLVDACHAQGLAVVLDVVYNHLGPEGNYLDEFGPYFTDRYKTPWGRALNFDGEECDHVRRFFIENALSWVTDFHVDALRLDAVHAIVDPSPIPFIEELCAAVHRRGKDLGRLVHCIAESAANDARLITPPEAGGYGAAAQWNDDFHHALRTTLTDERSGYYAGYEGLRHLEKALQHGFVFTGEHDPYRKRRHGSPSRHLPAERFVVFSQNHDQVGNRMLGERLSELVPFESLKLAAAATILSPFVPLLFMGEEYADPAPFLYFVSHTDPALVEAVRRGRAQEFAAFGWKGEPPDPQSTETFNRSRLNHPLRAQGRHAAMLAYYTDLLRLRREHPALANLSKDHLETQRDDRAQTLLIRRWAADRSGTAEAALLLNFARGGEPAVIRMPRGRWRMALDSSDHRYAGHGSTAPWEAEGGADVHIPSLSAIVYTREDEDA